MSISFAKFLRNNNDARVATKASDFVVRTRMPMWQVLSLMLLSLAFSLLFLGRIIPDTMIYSEVVFAILLVAGAYVVILLQNSRDLVLSTEFQNAILSSAFYQSNDLCLIMKNDGMVTHVSPTLQTLMPNFMSETQRSIDVFLEHAQVSKEQRKMFFASIDQKSKDRIILDITDSMKKNHRLIMSLEPIARPRGFMLLRGREFIEKRELASPLVDNNSSPLFNKANFDLLSSVTGSLNLGVYTTDGLGSINYANPTLEQWLYYDENEIISRNLSLKNILAQNGTETAVTDLQDFEGEVSLQLKVGGSINVLLTQRVMYDSQGISIGCVALIHLLEDTEKKESAADNKKNVW